MHERARDGYGTGMAPHPDPDDIDPTDQHGRGLMVAGALVGIFLALGAMLVVFTLLR